jgi:hypothetical protein
MYIYSGKFDWPQYAVNENITIVFPGCLSPGDAVCGYWQWSVDSNGKEKANSCLVIDDL